MSARGSAAGNSRGLPRKTWYFTFDLQASEVGVASQLEAFKSSPFRTRSMKTSSIISFSRSADGSPDIRGFTSGKTMWKSTVQAWLTNSAESALSNLQIHPISDRFNDRFIVSLLADSELPGGGESAMQGPRICMDTMNPSGAPRVRGGGRPRTRPLALGCGVGATGAAATAPHAGGGTVTAAGGDSKAASIGAIRASPTTLSAGTGTPVPTAVRDSGGCPGPGDGRRRPRQPRRYCHAHPVSTASASASASASVSASSAARHCRTRASGGGQRGLRRGRSRAGLLCSGSAPGRRWQGRGGDGSHGTYRGSIPCGGRRWRNYETKLYHRFHEAPTTKSGRSIQVRLKRN
jgi:hypothetical protein